MFGKECHVSGKNRKMTKESYSKAAREAREKMPKLNSEDAYLQMDKLMVKNMSCLPLFKSHFSLLKSILTLDEYTPQDQRDDFASDSIIDIAVDNNLGSVWLVEDTMASYVPAFLACQKAKLQLNFGYRVTFIEDVNNPDRDSETWHKNVIIPKNKSGYERLIKISTLASVNHFKKYPRLDYNVLHENWSDDDLFLAVPFYDSFIHRNNFGFSAAIPDLRQIKPIVFLEDNDLPFDELLREYAVEYAKNGNLETQETKSIYYKERKDFDAFTVFKCMNRKFGKQKSFEAPNLDHFGSEEFCFESWKEIE